MTQLTGTGPQVVSQGLFEEKESALHNVGEFIRSNDGRSYRYCKAGGTALAAGKLQQGVAEDTGDANLAIAASAADTNTITTTSTVTVTANQYANGFVVIADDAGEGFIYAIDSHPAATAAVVTLTLKDNIQVALTTSTTIDLISNPYDGVIICPTTLTSTPRGVAVTAMTAAYYGWLQVGGPASVLADGTLTIGLDVVASDNTAGAVEVTADGAPEQLPKVGRVLAASSSTEYAAIDLMMV